MIKLLLDENFPVPAAHRLGEAGLNVLAIRETGPAWPEEVVLALAVAEQRRIVTFDRNYGDLVFKMNLPTLPVNRTAP